VDKYDEKNRITICLKPTQKRCRRRVPA